MQTLLFLSNFLSQFNHFDTFAFGLFAEFIGFAVIFVISDDEVGIFYDIAVAIIIQQPVSNHQRQVDFQEY